MWHNVAHLRHSEHYAIQPYSNNFDDGESERISIYERIKTLIRRDDENRSLKVTMRESGPVKNDNSTSPPAIPGGSTGIR